MLPIKLKIQGINSYQKEQVIEFDKLLSSKVFGIFGEVGSGKSSILDAISFVLYGKMEKMNKSDGINYNLMNLKSDTFLIEYDFEVENNKKYRFVVKGRRNSKNFDDVKLTKFGYEWNNSEWLPLDDFNPEKKAEEVIGLSYDNFKRTIIIPQGKFMDFIRLKDAERTKMLKEIFNLQKFDLLDKVNILNRKNDNDIAVIEDNLKRLQDVNKEIIVENEEGLSKNTKKRKELRQQLELKENEFRSMSTIKEYFEELEGKKKKFINLSSKKELIVKKEKELAEYEICVLNFKPLLDTRELINSKIERNNIELQKSAQEFKSLRSTLKSSEQRFEVVQKDYENIDKYKKQNEEFGKLIVLKEIEKEILKSSENLENYNKDYNKILKEKKNEESQIEILNTQIKEKEKDLPDYSLLLEIKEWFSAKQELINSIEELEKSLGDREEELKILESRKSQIISVDDKKSLGIDLQKDVYSIIGQLESKLKKFGDGLKALQAKREKLIGKEQLKHYAHSLKEGEQCPVCGSEHHPNIVKVDNIDEEISQMKLRIKNGEGIIDKLRDYVGEFKLLQSKFESEQNNISDYKKKLKNKNRELNSFNKSYKWKIFSPQSREKVNRAFDKAKTLSNELKELRTNQEITLNKDKQLQKSLDVSQVNLSKAKDTLSNFMTKQDTLIKQLEVIKYSEFVGKSANEIGVEADILREEIKKLERDYKELGQEIKNLEINVQEYKTIIESINKTLNELKNEQVEINKSIKQKLSENNFESISNISQVLSKDIEINVLKKEIQEFKISYETLKNEISKLESSLKGKTFEKEIFSNLKTYIGELKISVEQIDNEIGSLKNIVKILKSDLAEKEKYQKEQEEKELRREDLKVMRSLFFGSGFVNFISTVRLQEVVNYANSRFQKLTRGSLKLELGEKNVFNVIDFLNGGKLRSIKTLSGGQTFQASLSLALALAGIVQKQNKSKHNFFFLDEGFGTQDEESLRLVFNTIKSLRKENRIVGLISHVPELKEEISTYLEVVNDEEKGSRILESWDLDSSSASI